MTTLSARPATASPPQSGHRMLALIVALFLLPFMIASGLFALGWGPGGHSHGELASDAAVLAAPLPLAGLQPVGDSPLPDSLAGRWTLVLLSRGACDALCETRLAALRRVQVATYKNMPRVRRLWVAPAGEAQAAAGRLLAQWPDLVAASPRSPAWMAQLPEPGGPSHRVLLLDPAGRPVLRYPEPFDARGMLRDLERLLKYSWIG